MYIKQERTIAPRWPQCVRVVRLLSYRGGAIEVSLEVPKSTRLATRLSSRRRAMVRLVARHKSSSTSTFGICEKNPMNFARLLGQNEHYSIRFHEAVAVAYEAQYPPKMYRVQVWKGGLPQRAGRKHFVKNGSSWRGA